MTLGEIVQFIKDGTHASFKDASYGYPLLSAKDVYSRKIHIPSDCRIISERDYMEIYKQYHLLPGDVLLTIVGSIGRTAIIDEKTKDIAFQRSVAIIRPKETLSSRYLAFALETTSSSNQLRKRTNQSAQGGVYLGSLSKVTIPVPSLSVQERIVSVLDRFDALVNDLSSGLPGELDARRRQYEYYRDRLLSFPPAV